MKSWTILGWTIEPAGATVDVPLLELSVRESVVAAAVALCGPCTVDKLTTATEDLAVPSEPPTERL